MVCSTENKPDRKEQQLITKTICHLPSVNFVYLC